MTSVLVVFYSFAVLTVLSALYILYTKNVVHAVLALLGVFLGVSALYVFAGADFLAITQLVVYIGGVLVLMLFGVMLTNRESGAVYPISKNQYLLVGLFSGIVLYGILLYLVLRNQEMFVLMKTNDAVQIPENTIRVLGVGLMSIYVLAFEVVGIVLLIALIGAAFIAGRKSEQLK